MKYLLGILLCLFCLTLPVRGMGEGAELEGFWQAAGSHGVEKETEVGAQVRQLLAGLPRQLKEYFTAGLRTGVSLLAVVILCALGEGMEGGQGRGLPLTRLAGAMAITALTMTDVDTLIGLGRDTIHRMEVFSTVLLPAMAVLTALSGSVTAGALGQGAAVFFYGLLVKAMDSLFVPLVYAYVAVSCAGAATGNPGLERLAQAVKSVITGLLTAVLLLFVGYLTAGGAVAGSVDLSRIKTARLAISRAIPVVGGILADASEAVLAGAGSLKGSVGGAGLAVVLAICLGPFLHLAAQYLIYKGTAALCALVARPELTRLIDAIGGAFGLILGMTGAGALILLVSIVTAVRTVTG